MTDRERFEEAWHTFQPKIHSYFQGHVDSKEDADDLCSEVFRKAWEHLEKNRDTGLSSYLYVISRNTLTDYYRTRKEALPLEHFEPVLPDFTEELLREETLKELGRALKELPEFQRDIIILHYYSGVSLADISKKMGVSYSIIKRGHRSALWKLREL